jgi:hypothetical protein
MVYERGTPKKQVIDRAAYGTTWSRVASEIKTYIRWLQAEGRGSEWDNVARFTRTFPDGGNYWTIQDFITKLEEAARGAGSDAAAQNYAVAMPKTDLIAYMRDWWDLHPVEEQNMGNYGPAVLGLTITNRATCGDLGSDRTAWNNLDHYVYQDSNGSIYSWGKKFDSLADCGAYQGFDFAVLFSLRLK